DPGRDTCVDAADARQAAAVWSSHGGGKQHFGLQQHGLLERDVDTVRPRLEAGQRLLDGERAALRLESPDPSLLAPVDKLKWRPDLAEIERCGDVLRQFCEGGHTHPLQRARVPARAPVRAGRGLASQRRLAAVTIAADGRKMLRLEVRN